MIDKKIRAARLAANLTQIQLAEKLGVPYQQIQKWESGERVPKLAAIKRIADALGVDWIELAE